MKSLFALVFITIFTVYFISVRNIREDKRVEITEAIEIVQSLAKKLASNTKNSSSNKLAESWRNVSIDGFKLVKETNKTYTVKGLNIKIKESLFFIIDKQGHVLEVMGADYFKSSQNHLL